MPNGWFITLIRATAFTTDDEGPTSAEVIRACFGEDPETEETKRPTSEATASIAVDSGRWHASAINRPQRLDLVQRASVNPWSDTRTFRTLADAVITSFVDLYVDHVVPLLPSSVHRLAIAAQARLQVDSAEEASQTLSSLVDELSLDPSDEEVVFRRNHPVVRMVGEDSVRMNRVWTWKTERAVMVIGPSVPAALALIGDAKKDHAISLDIDANTPHDYRDLKPEMYRSILTTLGNLTSDPFKAEGADDA